MNAQANNMIVIITARIYLVHTNVFVKKDLNYPMMEELVTVRNFFHAFLSSINVDV